MVSSHRALRALRAGRAAGLAGVTVAVLLLSVAVAPTAVGAPVEEVQDVKDGVDGSLAHGGGSTSGVVAGELCAAVPARTGNDHDVAVPHGAIAAEDGQEHDVSITARSTADASAGAQIGISSGAYPTSHAEQIDVTAAETPYGVSSTSSLDADAVETDGQPASQLGNQGESFTVCVDDVSMVPTGSTRELLPPLATPPSVATDTLTASTTGAPPLPPDPHDGDQPAAGEVAGVVTAPAQVTAADGTPVTPTVTVVPAVTVSASPGSVRIGSPVTITVSGMLPGESVRLSVLVDGGSGADLGAHVADASGSLVVTVRIPVGTPTGAGSVVAGGATSGRTGTAALTLLAAEGAGIPPARTPPTTAPGRAGGLATTGVETGWLLAAGLVLLMGGTGAVVVARRGRPGG